MTSECACDNWQTQVTRLFSTLRMPKAGIILSVVKERGWATIESEPCSDAEACVGMKGVCVSLMIC